MISFGTSLIISPHFDDACYSIGGTLIRDKYFDEKIILTIFTKSRYTAYNINLDEDIISQLREQEDIDFCKAIGAVQICLDYPDASSRNDEIFCNKHINECIVPYIEIIDSISRVLYEIIHFLANNRDLKTIFVPLAVGNHIDHIIAYYSFIRLIKENKLSKMIKYVIFYEDLPYASNYDLNGLDFIIRERMDLLRRNVESLIIDISDMIDKKLKLMRLYKTQTTDEILNEIYYHAKRLAMSEGQFMERLWLVA